MNEQTKIGQDELKYVYDSAKHRCEIHPEIAEKYGRIIEELPIYKDGNEAIKKAVSQRNKNNSHCQVWAKVSKENEYYFIQDYYIVSSDNRILMAAEYIGMEQIFVAE